MASADYSLYYGKELAKCLSRQKIKNYIHLRASYYKSIFFQKNYHQGYPVSLGIEPTTACNLRCPHCISGNRAFTRPTGKMSFELFQHLINETAPHLIFLVLYFQGEPYLNPFFLDMVSYAHAKKIFTMTSSNAHFLDSDRARWTVESGLHSLIVSVDGLCQDTYEQYRKEGNLQKVIEGIQNLVFWKRKLNSHLPLINFQFIVFKHNEHEIPLVAQFAKKLGVDKFSIKTAQIYEPESNTHWIPQNKGFSRYQFNKQGTLKIKNNLYNKCWRMWQGAEITHDGRVTPCCFDKNAEYTLGNLLESTGEGDFSSFIHIWKNSTAYYQFRQLLLTQRNQIEMCKNCTEGTQIWA